MDAASFIQTVYGPDELSGWVEWDIVGGNSKGSCSTEKIVFDFNGRREISIFQYRNKAFQEDIVRGIGYGDSLISRSSVVYFYRIVGEREGRGRVVRIVD